LFRHINDEVFHHRNQGFPVPELEPFSGVHSMALEFYYLTQGIHQQVVFDRIYLRLAAFFSKFALYPYGFVPFKITRFRTDLV
jgi:hypothetical protein